jgi:hypothetical protein
MVGAVPAPAPASNASDDVTASIAADGAAPPGSLLLLLPEESRRVQCVQEMEERQRRSLSMQEGSLRNTGAALFRCYGDMKARRFRGKVRVSV